VFAQVDLDGHRPAPCIGNVLDTSHIRCTGFRLKPSLILRPPRNEVYAARASARCSTSATS
jgi:hypothetical protein